MQGDRISCLGIRQERRAPCPGCNCRLWCCIATSASCTLHSRHRHPLWLSQGGAFYPTVLPSCFSRHCPLCGAAACPPAPWHQRQWRQAFRSPNMMLLAWIMTVLCACMRIHKNADACATRAHTGQIRTHNCTCKCTCAMLKCHTLSACYLLCACAPQRAASSST